MSNIDLVVVQQPSEVKINFEEVKAFLEEKMSIYDGAFFTEESKKEAKKEVAYLRKIKSSMQDKLKALKKQCLQPYEETKIKVDELIELVDKPINHINAQVIEYEKKRIEEKRERIKAIFIEINSLSEVRLDKIYNSRWENATVKESDIKKEIQERIATIKAGIDTISTFNSLAKDKALEMFLEDYDLVKALSYINNYEQQRMEIEKVEQERKAREQEIALERERERIRQEERKRIADEERIREEERKKIIEEQRNITPLEMCEEELVVACYKIRATEKELKQVEIAINSLGLEFERAE